MKQQLVLTLLMTTICSAKGFAAVEISGPAAGSLITKSSVLTGTCKGESDVRLSGSGIDSGKKISCQKKKYWSYELKNAYKRMSDGQITIRVAQGSSSVERRFVKGKGEVVVTPAPTPAPTPRPTPLPTPVPTPVPAEASCRLNAVTVAHLKTVKAYQQDRVAFGQTCESEVRQCVNGALSGSYTFANCTVEGPTNAGNENLDPRRAPASNFDLSLWKITLPVDAEGTLAGKAMEVKNIPSTYQRSPYFYTAADGAMVFMAPTDGARTSGSKYPRSELREMTSSGALAAWTVEQGGEMHATLSVNELPTTSSGTKGRIVIGQIHGPADELNRLYYDNGKLYFYDDKAGSSQTETQFVLKSASGEVTNIPLNAKFEYSIVVRNGLHTVSARFNGVEYVAVDRIGSFWPGKALYFKAGAYVQVSKPGSGAGTVGTGQGQVSFYRLSSPAH